MGFRAHCLKRKPKMEVRLWNLQKSFRNEFSNLLNPWNATKGLHSRTCWLSLLNQQKIKVAEQKWHSTFLRAKHFYFHEQHLFSYVNPILLCYRVLNMGRMAIFGHFLFIFSSLIADLVRGTATLQNEILTVLRYDHSLLIFMGFIL